MNQTPEMDEKKTSSPETIKAEMCRQTARFTLKKTLRQTNSLVRMVEFIV